MDSRVDAQFCAVNWRLMDQQNGRTLVDILRYRTPVDASQVNDNNCRSIGSNLYTYRFLIGRLGGFPYANGTRFGSPVWSLILTFMIFTPITRETARTVETKLDPRDFFGCVHSMHRYKHKHSRATIRITSMLGVLLVRAAVDVIMCVRVFFSFFIDSVFEWVSFREW